MLAETTRLEEQLKKVLVATCEACLTQDTSRLTFFYPYPSLCAASR